MTNYTGSGWDHYPALAIIIAAIWLGGIGGTGAVYLIVQAVRARKESRQLARVRRLVRQELTRQLNQRQGGAR